MKKHRSRTMLHVAKLILLVPLVLYLGFIIPERKGVWDHWSGLDLVEQVADRFDRSVGPADAVPVRVGDQEFAPLIRLIRTYSPNKLAADKNPQVVARFQAKVYDSYDLGNGTLAQWSSPVTPFAVMYFDFPHVKFPGDEVPKDQYVVVGTIGDLRRWIAKSREDRHFLVVDLILVAVVPLLVGLYELFVEMGYERAEGRVPA